MGHVRGLYHPRSFQLDGFGGQVVEQSPTLAEQHGHEVNLYFIEQPSAQVLLNDIRATRD